MHADFHVLSQSQRVRHHTVLSHGSNENGSRRKLQMKKMQMKKHGWEEVEIERHGNSRGTACSIGKRR